MEGKVFFKLVLIMCESFCDICLYKTFEESVECFLGFPEEVDELFISDGYCYMLHGLN